MKRIAILVGFLLASQSFAAEGLSKIKWETNLKEPLIGDPQAKQGGTFTMEYPDYPLTFRAFGPNANDMFKNVMRAHDVAFTLVKRHPTTDAYIPWLATAWSVQPDKKTIYYQLDPEARWSDGKPVTADDVVFAFEMLQSKYVVDPFWNTLMKERFESVEQISPHIVKIVGKYPSWRPLWDFGFFPMPRHATKLGPNWVTEANLQSPVVVGAYVITGSKPGESVTLSRVKNWWGTGKRYFKGMFNVERIVVKAIPDGDRAFDFFRKGDLSYIQMFMSKTWAQETDFEAVKKGWVRKKRVFVQAPQGAYGIALNLTRPIFQNKDFRKALQYGFDFDELNKNLMFNAYYRILSIAEGTEYQSPNLKPYPFDPAKVREHLNAAGFKRRGTDGIFVRDDGTRASFTVTNSTPSLVKHLTVIKQKYERLGIEMKIQNLEGGTAFERQLERKNESTVISYTANPFPDPHQYFGSEFAKTVNNNNVWGYASKKADELIDVYRYNMDLKKRLAAMEELDKLIQDEAILIPFWHGPFIRMLYWDYVKFPKFFVPKRANHKIEEWQVFWIDEAREKELKAAMASGKAFPVDPKVDEDPYGVKALYEK